MANVRPFGDMARSLAENDTAVWKYMGCAERPLLAFHQGTPVPMSSSRSEPTSSHGKKSHVLRGSGTRLASIACVPPSAILFNLLYRSLTLFQCLYFTFDMRFLSTRFKSCESDSCT